MCAAYRKNSTLYFRNAALAILQLLLPLILINYIIEVQHFGFATHFIRVTSFLFLMVSAHVMLLALCVRLAGRPKNGQMILSRYPATIQTLNTLLLAKILWFSPTLKRNEILRSEKIYLAEIYPFHWTRFLFGMVLSAATTSLFGLLASLVLWASGLFSIMNLSLLLGFVLFLFNMLLIIVLHTLRSRFVTSNRLAQKHEHETEYRGLQGD